MEIGLIGAGSIGTVHLSCLKKIIEDGVLSKHNKPIKIKGIADLDETKLNNLKKNNPYNVKLFTTDPDDLLRDKNIDIIYITTPTKFHLEYYIKAAEAGKHIFCEKPIAFSSREVNEMIKIRDKHGIFTQVGLVLRHDPVFWKIKKEIFENKEALGKPLSFIFRDSQEWPVGSKAHPSLWRKDPSLAHAGCLFEHSIHDVDMLEYLFADERNLAHVHANIRYISPLTQKSLEDVALLNFKYSDGFTGDLTSIWTMAKIDERRMEIYFENGYILVDGYNAGFKEFSTLINRKKKRLNFNDISSEYVNHRRFDLKSFGIGPFFFEDISFLESLLTENDPYPGLEIGLKAHQIIEAAYDSSYENRIVDLT